MLIDANAGHGVLYLAFGAEYVRVCAGSARSLRSHCALPIHVVTNVQSADDEDWPTGTELTYCKLPDKENRMVRTHADEYTPFDRTLMLDADIFVQQPDFLGPFGLLGDFDLVAMANQPLGKYAANAQGSEWWCPIQDEFGPGEHLTLFGGAMWFARNDRVSGFFGAWHDHWDAAGRGRDMPALMRAVRDSDVRCWTVPGRDGWLGRRGKAHVFLHSVRRNLRGMPKMRAKFRPTVLKPGETRCRWERVAMRNPPPPEGSVRDQRPRPSRPTRSREAQAVLESARPAIRRMADVFADRPPGELVGAEIGVYEGDHAESILAALEPKVLHLIDPWAALPGQAEWMRERRGQKGLMKWRAHDWDGIYRAVRDRFRSDRRAVFHRCSSARLPNLLEPSSCDFIYIDGSHMYEQKIEDLRNGWRCLRPGGVLAGHDYNDLEQQPDVTRAVDDFAGEIGQRPNSAGRDFWFEKPGGEE